MYLTEEELITLKDYVYSSQSDIEQELKRRREDVELKEKIESFFGPFMLDEFKNRPRSVLTRTIHTPNLELDYFVDISDHFNLEPLLLEYDGKFVSKNLEKYHLCKLSFLENIGKLKTESFASCTIVDFHHYEGQHMSTINTLWGENLTDFHHRILKKKYPALSEGVTDITHWFNNTRYLNESYYFYYFSLFIYHGVLFENFLIDDKEEAEFIKKHVLSSFKKIHEYFGVKPLIFPLLPVENEKFRSWYSYKYPDLKSEVNNSCMMIQKNDI